jgi:hypothetical protein
MPPHRGSAKALTLQRLPSRVIANATQEFVKPRCRMVGDAAQHGFGRAFCRRKLPGNGDSDPIFATGNSRFA